MFSTINFSAMKNSLYNRISIPVPCHEDWNKMTPDEKGAFCSSCNKSVYDFTKKDAAEVENILLSSKGQEVCGRFTTTQLSPQPDLHIPLQLLPHGLPVFRRFALAVFLVFGTSLFGCTDMNGQTLGKVKLEVVKEEELPITGEIQYIPENEQPLSCATITGEPVIMGDTLYEPGKGKIIVDTTLTYTSQPSITDTVKIIAESDSAPIELHMLGMVMIAIPEDVPALDVDTVKPVLVERDPEISFIEEERNNGHEETAFTAGGAKPGIQCYPNPSNGPVTVSYEIKERSDVLLEVFDARGRRVRTLIDIKNYYSGIYNTSFDLSELPAGNYTLRLRSGGEASAAGIIIMK